jgi:hypothetical protein
LIRHPRSKVAGISDRERPKRILGTIQDVTERRSAESQVAVNDALIAWESFEPGVERLLRKPL